MNHLDIWILVSVCFFASLMCSGAEPRVVCYYTNWAAYRPDAGKYSINTIDPHLCTHLVYSFGSITKKSTLQPSDPYQDITMDGYVTFAALKVANPKLKTLISFGGITEGSSTFSYIAADENRRRTLISNAVQFLRQNKFDGLDLNWHTPGQGKGSRPTDREGFFSLMRELWEEFVAEAEDRPRLLLTTTIPWEPNLIENGYDLHELNKYVDWMAIRSYDYYTPYNSPTANHHAPLFPLDSSGRSIDSTLKNLIKAGAHSEKMLLIITSYGRSFTLENPSETNIGAPTIGPAYAGPYTRDKGFLAYYETCENVRKTDAREKWTVVRTNGSAAVPYAFRENQWVGYDDMESVVLKAKYAAQHNLGGI